MRLKGKVKSELNLTQALKPIIKVINDSAFGGLGLIKVESESVSILHLDKSVQRIAFEYLTDCLTITWENAFKSETIKNTFLIPLNLSNSEAEAIGREMVSAVHSLVKANKIGVEYENGHKKSNYGKNHIIANTESFSQNDHKPFDISKAFTLPEINQEIKIPSLTYSDRIAQELNEFSFSHFLNDPKKNCERLRKEFETIGPIIPTEFSMNGRYGYPAFHLPDFLNSSDLNTQVLEKIITEPWKDIRVGSEPKPSFFGKVLNRRKKEIENIEYDYYSNLQTYWEQKLEERKLKHGMVNNIREEIFQVGFKFEILKTVSTDQVLRGPTENFFQKLLISKWPGKIYDNKITQDLHTGRPYVPDMIYLDEEKSIGIVIEIDEPYSSKGELIHLSQGGMLSKDDFRDYYFTGNGWSVIRFSERQIVSHSEVCVKFLEYCIDGMECFPMLFDASRYVFPKGLEEDYWTKEVAYKFRKQKYRSSYLNGNGFPFTEPIDGSWLDGSDLPF